MKLWLHAQEEFLSVFWNSGSLTGSDFVMPKSTPSAPLHRVAIEIGYISIYWAWLEDAVDELVTTLGPLERGQPAEAIMGNTDIRQKVQMVKALAFLRQGDHADWYTSVIETLNTIDNDLRGRRNQFVHAGWYTPKGKLTRQKKSVKLSKSQAFQSLTLSTNSRVEIKIDDVRSFRKGVLHAVKKVIYQAAFASRFDEVQSREISFQQFLHLAAPSVRRTRTPQKRQRVHKLHPG
jgi:hypothetical protein